MEPAGCVNIGSLTSALPVIPYRKLTDLHYISKGGFGTVFRAQHSDWRTTVESWWINGNMWASTPSYRCALVCLSVAFWLLFLCVSWLRGTGGAVLNEDN